MNATTQQNVMPLYAGAMPLQASFPCRPIAVGVIVAASSRRQAGHRVDHAQAHDTGDDARRSVWMAAAQAGDGVAYEALLRDCVPIIKSVARRRGVSADRIDDVVQDVLLTVHRARQTYDPNRSFTVWLCVITDRRAIDLLRQTRRQDVREVHAPLAFESYADQAADPAQGLVHAELDQDRNPRARAIAAAPTGGGSTSRARGAIARRRRRADAAHSGLAQGQSASRTQGASR